MEMDYVIGGMFCAWNGMCDVIIYTMLLQHYHEEAVPIVCRVFMLVFVGSGLVVPAIAAGPVAMAIAYLVEDLPRVGV